MAFGIERFRCVFSVSVLFYLNICKNGYRYVKNNLLLLWYRLLLSDLIILLFSLSCSGTQWQYFVSADLLVELTKCLLSSKVTSAVIIWRRHQVKFARLPKSSVEFVILAIIWLQTSGDLPILYCCV